MKKIWYKCQSATEQDGPRVRSGHSSPSGRAQVMEGSLHVCGLSTSSLWAPSVELPRAQGCTEHNSALSAAPSPHWLMNTHCRGISAANSQWPPGKCRDNLWFHSWLPTPSQFLSWLGSWFQCWPHGLWPQRNRIQPHFFALPLPVAWFITPRCPALWAAPRKCWVWDCEWLKTPNHAVQSPLLQPLPRLTRILQKDPRADFQHKSGLGETKTVTGSRKQNLTSKKGLKLTYNSRFFSKII